MKPTLFIVGAPKCGTTAWVHYLRSHPDIYFSPVKEPHYFCTDLLGFRFVTDHDRYLRLFSRSGKRKISAEASVMYLYSQSAAEEIAKFSPNAKIIIFLRDQEDFLPSLHHQYLYDFRESIDDFSQAWKLSGQRAANTIPDSCREPKLLDYEAIGRFSVQIERYFKHFPRENIRVFHFNDWIKNPRAAYLEIMRLLELDDDGRTSFPRVNEAKSHKNATLARLIVQPPKFAKKLVSLLKSITGRTSLGIAARATELMAVSGYRSSVDPQVKDEIRRHYEEDNRLVERRLWRPPRQ